jgi:SAM-dependent methyltransferase
MRPHYLQFDATYQRLKAKGSTWNTPADVAEATGLFREFLTAPEVRPHGRALELGCGAGELTTWLLHQGFELAGIDIAPTAVAWAQERLAAEGLKADLRVGSVLDRLPFEDARFDLAVDSHCLHCILGEDRPVCLEQVRRVLKPGGILHVATMCDELRDLEAGLVFDPATRLILREGVPIRQILPAAEIRAEVEAAGFQVVRWRVRTPEKANDAPMLVLNGLKL